MSHRLSDIVRSDWRFSSQKGRPTRSRVGSAADRAGVQRKGDRDVEKNGIGLLWAVVLLSGSAVWAIVTIIDAFSERYEVPWFVNLVFLSIFFAIHPRGREILRILVRRRDNGSGS